MILTPISEFQSAPFNGPFSIRSRLLDGITAAPFEGVWTPVDFVTRASLELLLTGTNPTAQVDLWVTNQRNPTNTYVATLGGSAQAADVVALLFTSPFLPSAGVSIPYTVAGGNTLTTIGAALAALVNANASLAALGVKAAAAVGVITITWPSVSPTQLAQQASQPPSVNSLALSSSVTGSGPTETVTITNGTDGTLVQSLGGPGITQAMIPWPVTSLKARLVALGGTTPVAMLRLSGAG